VSRALDYVLGLGIVIFHLVLLALERHEEREA
jgi:hypothetical protein